MIFSNAAFFYLMMAILVLAFGLLTFFSYLREIGSGTPKAKAIVAAVNPLRLKFTKTPLLPSEKIALFAALALIVIFFALLTALKLGYIGIEQRSQ